MKQLTDEALSEAYTVAMDMQLDMAFIKLLLDEIQERKMTNIPLKLQTAPFNNKNRNS